MARVNVEIGKRPFDVACEPGQEGFLKAAAALLDAEATELSAQIGRLPEQRMLLMAGLMLADKMATLKVQLAQAEEKLAQFAENQTGNDSGRLDAESLSILNRLVERGEELAELGR
ncbi:MAG: cell division protein ZapA [Rhodobacteraceae bacterium]|nr:cell division protein ZapA [Paracoccaceae bacterium]MBL6640603.1 cell division protein ZapA [Paracoccaceae bacterium]MBL6676000.1 cell division protein ZapA [Paracoccaceae bacterium]MBL6789870.1 cell division protein ZapA [Paracoccaceae bacterium]MBL6859951.1 cell division protein ZapA [Paracoccaceae bacterium]